MDINPRLAQCNSHRDIHTEIAGRELDIVRELGIDWPPQGRRTHIRCPLPNHPDQDPSWRFDVRKARCYCTCPEGNGSVVDLVMAMRGLSFKEACAWIRNEPLVRVAKAPPKPIIVRRRDDIEDKAAYQAQQQKKALYLWGGSLDAEGSLVEVYLRSRNLTGEIPLTVRYLPARPPEHPWPCVIAAYGLGDGLEPANVKDVTAVHLTKLATDGRGKAPIPKTEHRRTVGSPQGYPIMLAPPNDGLGLAVLEGIEKGMAYHAHTGLGAWAAGAASFMPALADKVPDYVECVTIWREADKSGRAGADGLKTRLLARGVEVVTVEAG